MSRAQKARSLVFGLGALGGTVAIFATVLEQLYGDPEKKRFKSQLSIEKLAFFYLHFVLFLIFKDFLFVIHSKKHMKANFSIYRSGKPSVDQPTVPEMEPKLGPSGASAGPKQ